MHTENLGQGKTGPRVGVGEGSGPALLHSTTLGGVANTLTCNRESPTPEWLLQSLIF
jgi:hypothetical protein